MKCLPKFAEVHEPSDLAKTAMNRAEEVIAICGHSDLIPGLAKLSFYKFIFLCGEAHLVLLSCSSIFVFLHFFTNGS